MEMGGAFREDRTSAAAWTSLCIQVGYLYKHSKIFLKDLVFGKYGQSTWKSSMWSIPAYDPPTHPPFYYLGHTSYFIIKELLAIYN